MCLLVIPSDLFQRGSPCILVSLNQGVDNQIHNVSQEKYDLLI